MPASRILLVDDQREVSRLLHSALDTLEYNLDIVEVPSGEEAILDSSLNPIDLLVSDYRLPGITGIELMRKIRRYRPNVKVILITGQADPNIRKEVSEAGADDFFLKPVPIADFLDSVEHQLGLAGSDLSPEPVSLGEETETQISLPDLMVRLRQELEAVVVILLDDKGSILANAEDLPAGNEKVSMLSSLLSIFSAGQNVSRLLGQKIPANWYIFDGTPFDLVFAPVGMKHSMLVIGKGLTEKEQVLKTFDKFSIASRKIEKILGESSSDAPAAAMPPASPPGADDPDMPEMGPLLRESLTKLNQTDVDDFWDKAADTHKTPIEPDRLSYDQAKEIGLGPEDEP